MCWVVAHHPHLPSPRNWSILIISDSPHTHALFTVKYFLNLAHVLNLLGFLIVYIAFMYQADGKRENDKRKRKCCEKLNLTNGLFIPEEKH